MRGNANGLWLFGVGDLGGEGDADGVVNLDGWVRVADSAAVVGSEVRNAARAKLDTLDLAELVFGLFGSNTVNGEATFNIVKQTEVLARLFNRNHIHEAARVGGVGSDLAVNLDQSLGDNHGDFASRQGVF